MTQLVTVLKTASCLSASLLERAEDPAFEDRERSAFRADALMVVSATQALSTSPAHGYDSDAYEASRVAVAEAVSASDQAAAGDANAIHHARLEVVQAVDALKAITARPAVSVS